MNASDTAIRKDGLRVCVQWPRFGPYHLARLRAVHETFCEQGMELVALETASRDALYAWKQEQDDTVFRRVQAFPGQVYENIAPRAMHAGIQEALDRIDPDVVAIHTYSLPDSRACLDWTRKRGRRAIVMTDSKADDAERSAWREWLKSGLIQSYDAALLAGEPQRAYFESLGFTSTAIFLGYDVVDNTYFAEAAARFAARDRASLSHLPGLEQPEPYFLASNRFLERKNLERLLDAYGAYRSSVAEPWRLIMLGDGHLRSHLEAVAPEGVIFPGFRQIEEIPAYYAHAGCFIHPCVIDTWALVVNEAMACGLPVLVSTGAGCHVDLVQVGVNGYTFDPFQPDDMTALMSTVSQDPDWRRNASDASRALIADWDLDRFTSALSDAVGYAMKRDTEWYRMRARLIVGLLRLSSSPTAFHTVES